MRKGLTSIGIISIIIGLFVLIGAAYFVYQKYLKISPQLPELKPSEQLELDILIPKTTYKTGEKFTNGKYWLKYEGPSFMGIVAYDEYKKGFENRASHGRSVGLIKTGDFDSGLQSHRQALIALNLNVTGNQDYFIEPGEYVYTISVFKCSDVGLIQNCDTRAATPELLSNFKPLKSASKTITVAGENVSKEVIKPSIPAEKTVLDCDNVKDPMCIYRFLDLFKENLKLCKPSKGTVVIGWEFAMGIFRSYEIIGVENHLCIINFSFLKTEQISPILLDKKMTCKYSDSERNTEKVAKADNCTGPLYDELKKIFEQQ